MSTTTEHDQAHDGLSTDTAVVTNPATQTDPDADTVAAATPDDRVHVRRTAPVAPAPHRQSDAPWIAVGLFAVATLVVAAMMWLSGTSAEPTSVDPVAPESATDTTVDSAAALERLVARGYVPPQVVDHEQAVSTELVRQGLVPDGRFDDPALQDLQTSGLVPGGVTIDEDGALRDLQSRGLVPGGRFDDPVLRDVQSRGHVPSARGGG